MFCVRSSRRATIACAASHVPIRIRADGADQIFPDTSR